jgi:hypothetical protein
MTEAEFQAALEVSIKNASGNGQLQENVDWQPKLAHRRLPWLPVFISLALVLPCFWHRRIEAGDLGSHTYNAWLAQLIARGQAPGLYIARQWNNVLCDLLVAFFGSLLGLQTAEKLVVTLTVLVFFWGAFALIRAATGRSPWFLTPAIAMVAYGWTFQMGFLNYYFSLGLAFLAVAVLWRAGKPYQWILGFVLAALAYVAHPIGFLFAVGAIAYMKLSASMNGWPRWTLFPAGLLALLAMHVYVSHRFLTFEPVMRHVVMFVGPDQLVVFGHRYRAVALLFALVLAGIGVQAVIAEFGIAEFWRRLRLPLELCLLAAFATAMLWGSVAIPGYFMSLGFLPQRVSSITAILLLCVLGCVQPRAWHLVALLACTSMFFAFLYGDTGIINRMEARAENVLTTLPPGTRVIATIWPLPGWRVGVDHIFDRACIGRCFAYSNYEPSTGQFRVRARTGNRIVVSAADAGLAMREGRYVVQSQDLPLLQLYQCDEKDLTRLCLRQLDAGEVNGRLGYHPTY